MDRHWRAGTQRYFGGRKLEDRSIGGIKFGVLNAGDEAVPDTRSPIMSLKN
jgi:hypothetical protein